jgi:lysine 2,3-aminomutase
MHKHAAKFPPVFKKHWADVPGEQWYSWTWQQQNRLTTLEEIVKIVVLKDSEKAAFKKCAEEFNVAITPYYAALMDETDENCPIRKQAIPSESELVKNEYESADPLSEDAQSPVPGLIHRYPDRVLLYTNHNCPVYCRHCTRKRKVSDPASMPFKNELETAIEYIRQNSQIRDVILSGGDPLSLSNTRLEELLKSLYEIRHVEIIRIGTRNPVTLPQRIDVELTAILKKYRPVYVMTHFNHPKECTREAFEAALKLADAGIPVMNQTVLLKGVNDSAEVLKELNHKLLMMNVRPYYLFQCDAAEGISHFRVGLAESLKIMEQLEGWTSGLAVPKLIVDLPDGGGKVHITPERIENRSSSDNFTFKNYRGEYVEYRDFNSA